jgi:hypothetical protein
VLTIVLDSSVSSLGAGFCLCDGGRGDLVFNEYGGSVGTSVTSPGG